MTQSIQVTGRRDGARRSGPPTRRGAAGLCWTQQIARRVRRPPPGTPQRRTVDLQRTWQINPCSRTKSCCDRTGLPHRRQGPISRPSSRSRNAASCSRVWASRALVTRGLDGLPPGRDLDVSCVPSSALDVSCMPSMLPQSSARTRGRCLHARVQDDPNRAGRPLTFDRLSVRERSAQVHARPDWGERHPLGASARERRSNEGGFA